MLLYLFLSLTSLCVCVQNFNCSYKNEIIFCRFFITLFSLNNILHNSKLQHYFQINPGPKTICFPPQLWLSCFMLSDEFNLSFYSASLIFPTIITPRAKYLNYWLFYVTLICRINEIFISLFFSWLFFSNIPLKNFRSFYWGLKQKNFFDWRDVKFIG